MFDKEKIEEAILTNYKKPDHGSGAIIKVEIDSGRMMFCAWPRMSNSIDVHFAAVEQFCKRYPECGPASAYSPGMVMDGFVWVKNHDPDR